MSERGGGGEPLSEWEGGGEPVFESGEHQPSSQTNCGVMKDVWDGTILQRLSAPGHFFSLKTNLALSLNTAGVPLYKSSTWSLWPVFLTILNLPASIRMKAENVLLAGLWYGPCKPPISSYWILF